MFVSSTVCQIYTFPAFMDIKHKENIKIIIYHILKYENIKICIGYQAKSQYCSQFQLYITHVCCVLRNISPFQRKAKRPTLQFGANFYWIPSSINSQSLEDTQVGYISQTTLWINTLRNEYLSLHIHFRAFKSSYTLLEHLSLHAP